jgi:hypothetical protein
MKEKLLSLLFSIASVSLVFAQQAATATVSGRVTDPNGAVVIGAKVIATQKATGAKREIVTNSEGLFTLTNLNPGEYELIFEKEGFKKQIFKEFAVQVGQSLSKDVQMELGQLNEILDGDFGAEPLVNTTNALVEGIVKPREISILPLNGRNYLELALLIPARGRGWSRSSRSSTSST